MRTDSSRGDIDDLADQLWQAADTLRGTVDAADYKHIVLGLLFLKYLSDRFDEHPETPRAEHEAPWHFRVPPESRWASLQARASHAHIARLLDDAILAIERDNERLQGKLPRDYERRGLPPEKLSGLIHLVSGIGFKQDLRRARDTLGRIYEYFLGRFAAAEGKLGGEFYTPRSIVRLLVELIEPYEGRVYDPCCGSGGMFVQSERFVEAHGGRRTDLSLFGQESNPTTWRLAHMNLALHQLEATLGSQAADTLLKDLHPELEADYILSNPPFNVSDWSGQLLRDDRRWRYGVPPLGNANYAWIQHFIHHLAEPQGRGGGVAGFVMANGSLSSHTGGEGEIRRQIIEADLVDCIVALPSQLFYTTGIPVCLWILTRDKTGRNLKHGGRPRHGETLFIDARGLGRMKTRTIRELTGDTESTDAQPPPPPPPDSDIGRMVYATRMWRGEPKPQDWTGPWQYADLPGFCRIASREEIARQHFILTPGRYVGTQEPEDDPEPFEERFKKFVAELDGQLAESERQSRKIRDVLSLLDVKRGL